MRHYQTETTVICDMYTIKTENNRDFAIAKLKFSYVKLMYQS